MTINKMVMVIIIIVHHHLLLLSTPRRSGMHGIERNLENGKTVTGKTVNGKMVNGKMVTGKMVNGKMVSGRRMSGRRMSGRIMGGSRTRIKTVIQRIENRKRMNEQRSERHQMIENNEIILLANWSRICESGTLKRKVMSMI